MTIPNRRSWWTLRTFECTSCHPAGLDPTFFKVVLRWWNKCLARPIDRLHLWAGHWLGRESSGSKHPLGPKLFLVYWACNGTFVFLEGFMWLSPKLGPKFIMVYQGKVASVSNCDCLEWNIFLMIMSTCFKEDVLSTEKRKKQETGTKTRKQN